MNAPQALRGGRTWLAAGLAAGLWGVAGHAQEPQVVVCEQGDVSRCVPVEQSSPPAYPPRAQYPAPAQAGPARPGMRVLPSSPPPAASAPARPYWEGPPGAQPPSPEPSYSPPQSYSPGIQPAPPPPQGTAYWQTQPPAGAYPPPPPPVAPEPPRVWLDWAQAPVATDPTYALPGVCARSADKARARFAVAAAQGDLNGLLGTYQWRGKTDAQATPIIARLEAVGTTGHWEKSHVTMWTGVDDLSRSGGHWRWREGNTALNFGLREVDGCWFVEFSGNPGQVIRARAPTAAAQYDQAGGGSYTPPPPPARQAEPVREENGVLVF